MWRFQSRRWSQSQTDARHTMLRRISGSCSWLQRWATLARGNTMEGDAVLTMCKSLCTDLFFSNVERRNREKWDCTRIHEKGWVLRACMANVAPRWEKKTIRSARLKHTFTHAYVHTEKTCYALRDMTKACGIHNFVKTKMLRSRCLCTSRIFPCFVKCLALIPSVPFRSSSSLATRVVILFPCFSPFIFARYIALVSLLVTFATYSATSRFASFSRFIPHRHDRKSSPGWKTFCRRNESIRIFTYNWAQDSTFPSIGCNELLWLVQQDEKRERKLFMSSQDPGNPS